MWIVTLLGGVRATVFTIATAACLVYIGILGYQIDHCQTEYKAQTAELNLAKANAEQLLASNTSKDAAVADLRKELDRLTGLQQEVQSARDAALTALATAEKQRDKALADARTARSTLYAHDAQSALWAQQPTARGITDQLRDLWAAAGSRDQGSSDREAGPPVRPDSAGAARSAAASTASAAGVHDCRDGCFSNDQVLDAVGACLTTLTETQDHLRAIATLEATAIAASHKPET